MQTSLYGIINNSAEVLAANRQGTYTVPNSRIFNSRFFWDTGIIANALAYYDPLQAAREVDHIIESQWSNGMFPNQVQDGRPWGQAKLFGTDHLSPDGFTTSGYSQPPLVIRSALEIGHKLPADERRAFYERAFPAFHDYLSWFLYERTTKDGLVVEIHPDESGMDNTPTWNELLRDKWLHDERTPTQTKLHQAGIVALGLGRRVFGDLRHLPVEQRASNEEAMMSFLQTRAIRRHGYDLTRIWQDSEAPLIISPGLNAVVEDACSALSQIADELANPAFAIQPDLLRKMQRLARAIDEKLWVSNLDSYDKSGYYSLNARTGQVIPIQTASGLIPLIGDIPKDRAQLLIEDQLLNPTKFGSNFPIPSVSMDSEHFDELGYWKGVSWPFIRYLVLGQGLRKQGREDLADEMERRIITRPSQPTAHEYDHYDTGEGMGIDNFATTAALDAIMAYRQKAKQKRYTRAHEQRRAS